MQNRDFDLPTGRKTTAQIEQEKRTADQRNELEREKKEQAERERRERERQRQEEEKRKKS